tara:strand:- start:2217 stop:4127 length:1911 start_codon:yes stop_codon:yes gene_type:complete
MTKYFISFLFFIGLFQVFSQDNQEVTDLLKSGIQKVFDEDFNKGLENFNKAIKLDPKGTLAHKVYFERAQLKRRFLKDFKGALNDYSLSINLNPEYIKAYVFRSVLYKRNFKNYNAEKKDLLKAIEIDPKCGICYSTLALVDGIDINKKIQYLEKALKLGTDLDFDGKLDPDYWIYGILAPIKIKQGDGLGAIDYMKKLIQNYKPIDNDGDGEYDEMYYVPDAYYNIARYYVDEQFGLKDYKLALENINKAIESRFEFTKSDPEDKDYYLLRSKINYNEGNYDDAKKDYEKAKSVITKLRFNEVIRDYTRIYPNIDLDRDLDSISFPIEVNTSIEVYDIYNLDTKNDQFFMDFDYNFYTKQSPRYVNIKKDTLDYFDLTKHINSKIIKSDRLIEREFKYLGYDNSGNNITDEYQYSGGAEADFFHSWNLQDYPFDKQKLQIDIELEIDTSMVRINHSKFFKSTFNKKMKGLKEGYKIDTILFKETYNNTDISNTFYPGIIRNAVYPVANYSIVISRSGGWLFVKLFLGSFLAFLISWLIFTIPKTNFESRIDLCVGAVFGAIGNKYFVESTTPATQVLTKADLLNNLVILLVLMNIVIIIMQHNKKINFGKFEDSKFSLIFSGVTMVVLSTLIIIF